MFRFRTPVHKLREKASARLATVSRQEVMDWAQVAIDAAWAALDAYQREPNPDSLEDVERGLQQVLGAVDDLRRRDSGSTS